jgi:hypothetical protein
MEGRRDVTSLSTTMTAALLALASVAGVAAAPTAARAQAAGVDPQAAKLLERMTTYLGSLPAFSVDTQNTVEELLDSGQKIQLDVWASALVQRPNKLRAERKGLVNQVVATFTGRSSRETSSST